MTSKIAGRFNRGKNKESDGSSDEEGRNPRRRGITWTEVIESLLMKPPTSNIDTNDRSSPMARNSVGVKSVDERLEFKIKNDDFKAKTTTLMLSRAPTSTVEPTFTLAQVCEMIVEDMGLRLHSWGRLSDDKEWVESVSLVGGEVRDSCDCEHEGLNFG